MINKAELVCLRSSVVAQSVKNPPAMQETRVQSLGGEDALKEEMATHSSILAWRIPGTEEAGEQHGDTRSQIQLSNKPSLSQLVEGREATWEPGAPVNRHEVEAILGHPATRQPARLPKTHRRSQQNEPKQPRQKHYPANSKNREANKITMVCSH